MLVRASDCAGGAVENEYVPSRVAPIPEHGVLNAPPHILNRPPGISLKPEPVESLSHDPKLNDKVAGQVLGFGFAALI
jgi:hypothetical protein